MGSDIGIYSKLLSIYSLVLTNICWMILCTNNFIHFSSWDMICTWAHTSCWSRKFDVYWEHNMCQALFLTFFFNVLSHLILITALLDRFIIILSFNKLGEWATERFSKLFRILPTTNGGIETKPSSVVGSSLHALKYSVIAVLQ